MGITELFIADRDTDTERVCGTCGVLKPVSEFFRDGRYSDGRVRYRRDCKECYKKTRMIELSAKTKGGAK